jgi:hypothetical protein
MQVASSTAHDLARASAGGHSETRADGTAPDVVTAEQQLCCQLQQLSCAVARAARKPVTEARKAS